MSKVPPRRATRLVRSGLARSPFKETAEALYLTSGFVYDSAEEADARFAGTAPGFLYGRYANPTQRMFEERLASLEEAEDCLAVGSGMAAVHTAVMGAVSAGDHVIAARALFSSCLWILDTLAPRYGVKVTLVDGGDLDQWRDAAKNGVKLALLETPGNPTLGGVDIAAVSEIIRAAGGMTIVDNVFASPVLQHPLKHGADLVVYSATKHIDGQGRTLGGALVGPKKLLDETYREFTRHTGPAISPFNCWVLTKGLETIALRVEAMSRTAATLADRFAGHPKLASLAYPGREDHPDRAIHARQMAAGGTLIALEIGGGREGAFRFLNALEIVDISNNLGDSKSLAAHPETSTHRRLQEADRARIGIRGGSVRLSVGLEDVDDLSEDVERALRVV
jgi:O-succinylhomoserine sulfhydrylase